jgi:serine/threonine protein kinase
MDGKSCVVEVFPTADSNEFPLLFDNVFRDGHGFIITYNITSRASFDSVMKHFNRIARSKGIDMHNDTAKGIRCHQLPIILLGINNEPGSERQVANDTGMQFARDIRCDFYEVSTGENSGVENIFNEMVRKVRILRLRQRLNPDITPNWWAGEGVGQLGRLLSDDSNMLLAVDDNKVLKVDYGTVKSMEKLENERRTYRHLDQKRALPNILTCFDSEDPRGLVLECCWETARSRINRRGPRDDEQIYKWAQQSVHALVFLHSSGIIHGDFGCHRMLLDRDDNIKVCGFSNAKIATLEDLSTSTLQKLGSEMTVVSQGEDRTLVHVEFPTNPVLSDLFAFGSAIYEMVTRKFPTDGVPDDLVESQTSGIYFSLAYQSMLESDECLREVMERCWKQIYSSAAEISRDVGPRALATGLTLKD